MKLVHRDQMDNPNPSEVEELLDDALEKLNHSIANLQRVVDMIGTLKAQNDDLI